MKKWLKFIFSFFIILLISGCSMLEGLLVPNTSTSSGAYVPNYPIYSSSASSSTSSSSKPSTSSTSSKPSTSSSSSKPSTSTIKPSTSSTSSSSSEVEDPLEFVVECINKYETTVLGLDQYENRVYYTSEEFYFVSDTYCRVVNKYNNNVLYADFYVPIDGYRFVRFEIENPDAPQNEFKTYATIESYNPYVSYSVVGSFAESLWLNDFYLTKQSDYYYVSDILYFP